MWLTNETASTKILYNKWKRLLLITNVMQYDHRSDIPIVDQ